MRELIPAYNLNLVARRRKWFPGQLAVWIFLLGLHEVWPIGIIVWEKPAQNKK